MAAIAVENPSMGYGRREVAVPGALLGDFLTLKQVPLAIWQETFPKLPPLIANEFVVMQADGEECDFSQFENVGRYDAKQEAIVPLRHVRQFPIVARNAGQAMLMEALINTDIAAVICTGAAGTGKTLIATACGLSACASGLYDGITVVPCESQVALGALPGNLDEKMAPLVAPFYDAIRNYQRLVKAAQSSDTPRKGKGRERRGDKRRDKHERQERGARNGLAPHERVEQVWREKFDAIPIDHAQGHDFWRRFIIYDEAQDLLDRQVDMLIKRASQGSKVILTGDTAQVHLCGVTEEHNGITYATKWLCNSPLVAVVHLTADEVVRSPLVGLLTGRQEEHRRTNAMPWLPLAPYNT